MSLDAFSRLWRSFRVRVIALAMCSSIFPTFCLGGLGYWALRHYILDSYQNVLASVAHESARQLDLWLTEQESTVASLARAGELSENWTTWKRLSPASDDAFVHLFRIHRMLRVCNDSSRWITEVRLMDTDGRVVLSDNIDEVKGLRISKDVGIDFAEIVKSGRVLHTSVYRAVEPAPLSQDDSDTLSTGFPTMFVLAPIKGEAAVTGVLGCRLAVADLGRQFPKEAGNLPLDVFLVGPDGHLIASNKEPRPWDQVQALPGDGVNIQLGRDLEGYTSYAGKLVVGAWEKVDHNRDWTVVAQVPLEALTRPLSPVLAETTLISVGLGAAFALLGFLLVRYQLSPLRKVIQAAQQLSLGDRSARVNLPRHDEIGQLGLSFDQMAATVETALAELEGARDQALAATKAKSRFLANMTHELRTPLNAVIGYSEMLIAEAQDAGQADLIADLEVIRQAGKDLLELINGILDVSKVEAGKMEVQREPFPLEELFGEIATLFVPLVQGNGNQLKTSLAAVGDIWMDRPKLKQILVNLLSNACKFTKNGSIELVARRQGDELWIEVKDSGIGMSQEQRERVFEEFSQADSSTTRKYGGTGLGLTIVQRFTELLDGQVRVESELGKGSTFFLHFPNVTTPPSLGEDA